MNQAPPPTHDQLSTLAKELSTRGRLDLRDRLPGGLGCTMDVVELREQGNASRKLVLRRHQVGAHGDPTNAAAREFAVLTLLRKHEIPVPGPVWLDTRGLFEEHALVISFLDGMPLNVPDDPLDWAEQLALTLVRIHAVPVDPGTARWLRDINSLVPNRLNSQPSVGVAGHLLGPRLWARMRQELEIIQLAGPVLCHGDYHAGNTLWTDQKLVAVVDWEQPAMADPAFDVAYCATDMRYVGQDAAADRFVEVYRSETGRSLRSLNYWTMAALCRPMPDIAGWLPSLQAAGYPGLTATGLRHCNAALAERRLR